MKSKKNNQNRDLYSVILVFKSFWFMVVSIFQVLFVVLVSITGAGGVTWTNNYHSISKFHKSTLEPRSCLIVLARKHADYAQLRASWSKEMWAITFSILIKSIKQTYTKVYAWLLTQLQWLCHSKKLSTCNTILIHNLIEYQKTNYTELHVYHKLVTHQNFFFQFENNI